MSAGSHPLDVLDHADRFEEIVFALIMVLTYTCSLSVANSGRTEVQDMLLGAIGCNLAWGIIDGAFYLVTCLVERGRSNDLVRKVRHAAAEEGRQVIAEALPEVVAEAFAPQDLERFRAVIAAHPEPPARVKFEMRDALGALMVFVLVVLATLPVIVPFLVFSSIHIALRISNGIALVLLFGVSFRLARHYGLRPIRMSAAMVGIGAVMVAVAIALGG